MQIILTNLGKMYRDKDFNKDVQSVLDFWNMIERGDINPVVSHETTLNLSVVEKEERCARYLTDKIRKGDPFYV